MKRTVSLIISVFLIFALFPSAAADEYLNELENGQLINIDADNGLNYRADFYLASVSSLSRSGDDLLLRFGLGQIALNGFFSHGRQSRYIRFADGNCVSGSDFDENGQYTGGGYTGTAFDKENQEERIEYSLDPDSTYDFEVRRDASGTNIIKDGVSVYGADKQRCVEKYTELFGGTDYRPDHWTANTLFLKEQEDSSFKAVRQQCESVSGYTVTSNAPEIVLILGENEIKAMSEGRAAINYVNSIGEKIASLNFKAEKEGDSLSLSCLCPQCGEDTKGEIHLRACGHYSCVEGFTDEEHIIAECGIAGHCAASGESHALCKNCQGYMCDGREHGSGKCQHVHQWFVVSYIPPSEAGPGTSVSICLTCNNTLTQTIGLG